MKKVELVDISKSYDKQVNVLSTINVTIEPGEFFVLVGPSGCGKSTMLRLIAGLEEITSGTLKIGDENANELPPNKRDLSMVFQNYALYPHLSVQQNITFGLDVKKVKKNEQLARAKEVAEMLGLADFLTRKPRELSGGQRQRVALARAIVSDSPICLMDEPLSNLDAKLRAHMRSEIRRLQRKFNITMIYVTHDQVEAMTMGDRIMILHNGVIQQIGKPIDLYNQPANPFVATFIGSPPMNLANAKVGEVEDLLIIEDTLSIPLAKEEAAKLRGCTWQVGIRPEFLQANQDKEHPQIVTISNIEVLGHETILSFYVGNTEWHAKWSGQWDVRIGERIPITVPYESICIFEIETGELLKKINVPQQVVPGEVVL